LGKKYGRIIKMIFFLFLFFMPSWLTGYLMNNVGKRDPLLQQIIETVLAIPTWIIGSTLLAIALVLALFSYIMSVRIYMNKEF